MVTVILKHIISAKEKKFGQLGQLVFIINTK